MPATLSPITESFEADDAGIQAILTDPAGGAATYGPLIKVPGIKTAILTGQAKVDDLRGAGQLIDSRMKLQSLQMAITHAQLDLTALAVMLGGTQSLTGVDPNGIQKFAFNKSNMQSFPVFRFEAQSLTGPVEGGDAHIVCYKCRLDSMPQLGFADETFHIFNASFRLLPLRGTQAPGATFDYIMNGVAVAITAAT